MAHYSIHAFVKECERDVMLINGIQIWRLDAGSDTMQRDTMVECEA